MTKNRLIAIILAIGSILIFIFYRGFYSKGPLANTTSNTAPAKQQTENSQPEIVSTNPNPLEEAVILPSQVVELTFNQPLENRGELKNRIEPKLDYEIKLSDDRKTAKITTHQGFALGTTYTLFIMPDSKFDGKKLLGREYIFHFKTIEYKGV